MAKRNRRKKPSLPKFSLDTALNNIKIAIADYFRKALPGIEDPLRHVLVVKGNIWIPVETIHTSSKDGMVHHAFKYAYYSKEEVVGKTNCATVTLCTNVPDSIHNLGFLKVDDERGVVDCGEWIDSRGKNRPTGRMVKTLGEYACTAREMINEAEEISYLFFSNKRGNPEKTGDKFQHSDVPADHYPACAWLATYHCLWYLQEADPGASDLVTKAILFLIYQDKTLLFKNSTAPVLLKVVTALGLTDFPTAVGILEKWTATQKFSDEKLLAATASREVTRHVLLSQPRAVRELLVDRYEEIGEIDSFIARCPKLSYLLKNKAEYYGGFLGIAFKYKNKLSKAKTAYELSLQLQPDNDYLGNYATILYRLGHYREAEKYALECASKESRKAYAYMRLGHIYFAMQEYRKASHYYSMGMAENKGQKFEKGRWTYHTAYLDCSLWNAIIDCCVGSGSNLDYTKLEQYNAVYRKETLYLTSLYDYVKLLLETIDPPKSLLGLLNVIRKAPPVAESECDRKFREKSTEYFGYLKKNLNSVQAEDKDIFVWMALLDQGRIQQEWLADLIADRACSMVNVLSVRNPEGDVRGQINNKLKPLILKVTRLYLDRFRACKKALALLEFYNGVVFRFDLEAIKSTDLTEVKKQLEHLASRLYLDADDTPDDNTAPGEVRKSFTVVDKGQASMYEAAYQKYFTIIKDFHVSLESFREYCDSIDIVALSSRPGQVVLEFVQENDLCGVFVMQGRGVEFVPLDLAAYSSALEDFNREIGRAESDCLFEDFENELQAILAHLSEQANRDIFSRIEFRLGMSIRIVQTGMFHLLPFHALEVDGKRLVEAANISYSSNITIFNDSGALKGHYLLVGNPEFEDRPLGGTEAEIAAIKEFLPEGSTITLMRQEATKQKFLASLKPGTNLHLACHAQFNDDYPMTSMFNLYPLDDEIGANISAGEIVAWDLKGCNFVFLSACDSGKGKVLTGNEAMGLPRGFIMAGASNVICTMWSLHDDYAPNVATSFYRHFHIREDVVHAFNQSLRDAIDDRVPLFAWAPFKLLTACQPS